MKRIKIYWSYIVFVVLLVLVYGIVFFWPASSDNLSLNPSLTEEYWRFGTYQFAHLNWSHLVQNIVTLVLVSFIAVELKVKFKFFSMNYFVAGLVAVLPLWIISPFVALGASVAIYSCFGFFSPKTKQFKLKIWLVIIFIKIFIFLKPALALIDGAGFGFALKQSLAHFSGFVFGLIGFYGFKEVDKFLIRRKQYILRRI